MDGAFQARLLHAKHFYRTQSGIKCKGACTHVAVEGKQRCYQKALKLRIAWLALSCPCYNYCGGECLPCEPGKTPSPARKLTATDGRLLGVVIPPKMGMEQDGKKKYMTLFLNSLNSVLFSPGLNSTYLSWACSHDQLQTQEQELQWDPELNQPLSPLQ